MAARWLSQAKALPGESPALAPNAQLYDFAMALQVRGASCCSCLRIQDGTVLCMAANKLSSNIVKNINQKPEKQV